MELRAKATDKRSPRNFSIPRGPHRRGPAEFEPLAAALLAVENGVHVQQTESICVNRFGGA
jgi:hypothetical protein